MGDYNFLWEFNNFLWEKIFLWENLKSHGILKFPMGEFNFPWEIKYSHGNLKNPMGICTLFAYYLTCQTCSGKL